MPFYEYRCNACGHQFEVSQRMSDDPISVCESCGASEVERLLFAPAIHFKGSGFHNTDYGTKRRPVGGEGGGDGGSSAAAGGASDGGGASSASGGSDSSSSGKTVGLDKV